MKIPYTEIIEGNLKAVKDTGNFGGVNKWNLHVKNTNDMFESVQWMDVTHIQKFFNEKLPIYKTEGNLKITKV